MDADSPYGAFEQLKVQSTDTRVGVRVQFTIVFVPSSKGGYPYTIRNLCDRLIGYRQRRCCVSTATRLTAILRLTLSFRAFLFVTTTPEVVRTLMTRIVIGVVVPHHLGFVNLTVSTCTTTILVNLLVVFGVGPTGIVVYGPHEDSFPAASVVRCATWWVLAG